MQIKKKIILWAAILVIFFGLGLLNTFGQTGGVKPANVDFLPQMAREYGWVITRGDKEYLRLGQRIGREGANEIGVWVYGGLPFAPSSLAVNGALETPLVIKIVGFKDRQLIPEEESLVPVYERLDPQSGKISSTSFSQAENVTWLFPKAGLKFVVDGKQYWVKNRNASIRFTAGGFKIEGLSVTPIKSVKGVK
jgi:hypothetical protein